LYVILAKFNFTWRSEREHAGPYANAICIVCRRSVPLIVPAVPVRRPDIMLVGRSKLAKLLFDKHFKNEQVELVGSIAERIQLLGGVSIAMAADVAETTQIERPPRGREGVPVQLSRLLDAHEIIVRQTRRLARRAAELGDDGTNDLLAGTVLRTNEFQVWFLSEHLVDVPLIKAQATSSGVA
jgi:hypothetical protein